MAVRSPVFARAWGFMGTAILPALPSPQGGLFGSRCTEALLEPLREILTCKPMILRAPRLDLDGPEERGDTPRRLPVEPVNKSVQEPCPVGVAAARRVDDGFGGSAGDGDRAVPGMDRGALRPKCHDQRIHLRNHVLDVPAGLLLEHL